MEGYVHSIETMGTLDGPGIRTVVFMQGCTGRCIYCHNPDTWPLHQGKIYNEYEIVKIAERYKPYYEKNGGVTFSGGEALIQGGFVLACMKALAEKDIPVVIDVSGTYVDVNTREIFRLAQLILLDIKHTKRKEFFEITKRPIDSLFRIIEIINEEETPVWIRQVVVPGINDTVEEIYALREFIKFIPTVEKIELLAYHDMGKSKWEQMGMNYTLKDTLPLTPEKLQDLQSLLPIYL